MTASCTAMSSGNPATRADPAGAFDGGVGQLLRYCGKLRTAGDLVTAAGLCERAHRLDPANPEPLMQLAGILTELGDLNLATKVYQTLIATSPDHVEARYELAKTYIALTQYDLALNQLQAALRHRSDDPRIYNALGIANGLMGAHETAEEVFQAGLAVAPDNRSLRNNLGLSLVLRGRYHEGIAVLEELAAHPAAAETSQQNLQLAYGLASAAKAEATLAEIEPVADRAPGSRDDDGARIAARRRETAEQGSQDEIRDAVPWADPISRRAEVGIFEDTDPLGGGTDVHATPLPVTEPAPGIHDPAEVLRADDGTGAGAPSDPPSERIVPTSVQTAELDPSPAVDAGPLVVFGDYLSAEVNLEDPAAEDTTLAEVRPADSGATRLAEADPAAAETEAEGAPAPRVAA
ncbi:MAG: tetratricopeptide repeat protein, partial [Kiloniellaceae bacterium]